VMRGLSRERTGRVCESWPRDAQIKARSLTRP
jgi:hypothetical protein